MAADLSDSPYYRYITSNHNPASGINYNLIGAQEIIGILEDVVSGVNYLGQSAGSYTYFTSSAPASGASIDLNIDGGTGTYDVVATVPAYNDIPGGAELGRSFNRGTAEGILVEHFTYIKPPTGTQLYQRAGYACEGELPPGHTYLDAAVMPTTDHSNTR